MAVSDVSRLEDIWGLGTPETECVAARGRTGGCEATKEPTRGIPITRRGRPYVVLDRQA
jgi:hypothetical protein